MKEVLHKLRGTDIDDNSGKVTWKCPSNIALIKYWGKFGKQMPANPSLSFSLENSFTETSIEYSPKEDKEEISIEFKFEGQKNEQFEERIRKYLKSIHTLFPLLNTHHLEIDSKNSFPHSSGIASSASAMGALALGLVEIQNKLAKKPLLDNDSSRLASYIARLGSGSACRSVYGGYTVWGKSKSIKGSSDLYAIPYPYDIHPDFTTLHDDILIVEKGKKAVSSSAGHDLMHGHPFAEKRFKVARKRMHEIKSILADGDMVSFGKLVEQEALMLHSMMMTSEPYFILFKPNTLSIVNAVWNFRRDTNLGLYFTLDAGANVHLIYKDENKEEIRHFIENELLGYCENQQYLCDFVGKGPQRVIA